MRFPFLLSLGLSSFVTPAIDVKVWFLNSCLVLISNLVKDATHFQLLSCSVWKSSSFYISPLSGFSPVNHRTEKVYFLPHCRACCGFVLIEMFVIFEGAFGLWSAVHVCLRSRELLPGFHNHYGLCQTEEAGRWWDVEQVPRLHCSAPYPCSGFSVTCHQGKTRITQWN